VLELMEAAEEEIGAAVAEAYAEGYKAAMLRYAPEAELHKTLAADIQAELEAEQKKGRYFWPALGVSAGLSFAAGFLCSFVIAGR
jgi:NAD(P)-dependent dehydrogenase (short-subunit alcohol dehydrogenase family)